MSTQQPEALRLTEIARYCFRSEGMSDPPEQFESPTGDMVDYFDHVEIEKELHARITALESQLAQRFDAADVATASAQGFRDGVASVSAGWISVEERLPEVGVTVLVYEPFRHGEDWPGTVRILFDYICPDYEDWHDHCASHEHFMAVGGANACGPDVTCTGPSEKAPYTHWMPLPAAPGPADGESNE